ncbi:hypothetical protein BDK51DRAFT_36507 [Blyttiomyces helicus]|uniref:Uncharacterized protein n=1 Tax=Blyttiomyces helicus TaxID=388810 RepID=A0A4P9WGY5_9FUNG|nr:hypothetical protein BDK51DRAFT_36507 [Blyttiomyces helicus]|eukprot:RKO90648.1 hypothetical protein BDK51DRAFT_36507 [Blyttiomyces helicus]
MDALVSTRKTYSIILASLGAWDGEANHLYSRLGDGVRPAKDVGRRRKRRSLSRQEGVPEPWLKREAWQQTAVSGSQKFPGQRETRAASCPKCTILRIRLGWGPGCCQNSSEDELK